MNVKKSSIFTSLACAVTVTLATAGTSTAQNLISSPDYSTLNGVWEGWVGGDFPPGGWVAAAGGVATVTPPSPIEANFYQSFGAGPAGNPPLTLGIPYSFTIESSNSSLDAGTSSAVAWVKAFDGGWGFLGAEFQTVPLAFDGSTTTVNFTPVAGVFYQVGTFTIGTTSGSYDLRNPSLVVVPEPATFALAGLGAAALLIFRRRR